jgi:gliding motility-associated-like protein
MRFLTFVFAAIFSLHLSAQVGQNLVTHISFDKNGCEVVDEGSDPDIKVFTSGDDACGCGIVGNARYFDGDGDWFYLFGNRVEDVLTTKDFSLSFYFKATTSSAANQSLFSKRDSCASNGGFAIRYNPASRSLGVELNESATISSSITKTLPFSCWYHVVVIRKGGLLSLYVNKSKLGETNAGIVRVNITNSSQLTIGSDNCNVTEDFEGYIDEIRLYNRAISLQDVEDLYFSPNQIATGLKSTGVNDTMIFLGGYVPVELSSTCATLFSWTPTADVITPDIPNPVISPANEGTYTYTVEMTDTENCVSTDSLRIKVIDPTTVKCGDILLPSAFTPNGDGLNDRYGISNPFATGELISFEIFDRWGNLVFFTDDVFGRWDGSFKGEPVNPAVFLYKVRYRCEGEEYVKSGSVTVLR